MAWSALISEPIPPSMRGNLLLDQNNDGRLDAVQFEFVSNINPEYLQTVFDSVVMVWPDTLGQPLRLVLLGSDLVIDPRRSRRVTHQFSSHHPLAKRLTHLGSLQYPFVYGKAHYYAAGDTIPLPIHMVDAMFPVITEARLNNSLKNDPDTLRITLSEPIAFPSTQETPILAIRNTQSTTSWPLLASHTQWIDQSHLFLLIPPDHQPRPANGDSVRIAHATLQDLAGNPSHPESNSYQVLQGRFPFRLQSQSMAIASSGDWLNRPLYQIEFTPFEDSITSQDWLGIGMDFGSANLAATIQSKLSGAQRFQTIDPAKIQWALDLRVYSNDGQPIHRSHLQITCADPRFAPMNPSPITAGNCLEHPSKVFLRWNLRSQNGRLAANGVYIAQISSQITYNGALIHAVSPSMEEGRAFWGILRRTHGTP